MGGEVGVGDPASRLKENKIRANIWKFYLFNILSGFVLYYAIDKIFM